MSCCSPHSWNFGSRKSFTCRDVGLNPQLWPDIYLLCEDNPPQSHDAALIPNIWEFGMNVRCLVSTWDLCDLVQDPEPGMLEKCWWWGCWHRCWQKWGSWGHLCRHSGQHPHFCHHLCQHPRKHSSSIPLSYSPIGVLCQVARISNVDLIPQESNMQFLVDVWVFVVLSFRVGARDEELEEGGVSPLIEICRGESEEVGRRCGAQGREGPTRLSFPWGRIPTKNDSISQGANSEDLFGRNCGLDA